MDFPKGLGIGAALKRGPVEDVIVTKDGTKLVDLKPGSVVGTGSLRRELQIRALNPQVVIRPIRGNVQTRLKKMCIRDSDIIGKTKRNEEIYDLMSVLIMRYNDKTELKDKTLQMLQTLSSDILSKE